MKQVRKFNKLAAKLGFTLIELSIVLVIIGLIVGGILVGQDLIKAAEIRATVSQLEKYSTAVNTFRGKYNGLPGDLLNASNFGFDARTGTDGLGDGDGLIESAASGAAGSWAGETACFWDDLSIAGLISENLNASGACEDNVSVTTISTVLPVTKMGRGNYVLSGTSSGVNYWGLTGVTAIASNAYSMSDLITPSEAFQIDSKLDDGVATSGSVQAMQNSVVNGLWATQDTTAADCVGAAGSYDFGTNSGATQACALRVRSSF